MTASKEYLANNNGEPQKPDQKFGTRHYIVFMLFLGMANAYVMRTNMSVAIVAMVNQTAIDKDAEEFDDECPDTDYGDEKDDSVDGEFIWSTSMQGYILSSFFYGYVITQIPDEPRPEPRRRTPS